MNFLEILELHRAISSFYAGNLQECPRLGVFDFQDNLDGYVLCVKKTVVDSKFLSYLMRLANGRSLDLREFRGFLVLYSHSFSWK